MNENTTISEKVKTEIERFTQRITQDLSRPKKRFVSQMLFGMQASRDVKLSNIARSLEEDIKLIKTENRLSRNAQNMDLTEKLNESLIKEAKKRIMKDTVLALDLSDINKPFAKKMDYLAGVWDGSEGKSAQGYWMTQVSAADVKGEVIIPMYQELYPHEADGFESENEQILKAVRLINEKAQKRGIWALDRGADRKILVEEFDKLGAKFVIRIKGNRNLLNRNNQQQKVVDIARRIRCNERYTVTVDREGYKEDIEARLGIRRSLRLKGVKLSLVIVKGFGKDPMLLLTNIDKDAKEVLEIYLTRWKCEESFRFLKHEYKLEDIRVRRYTCLRNTVVLLHAVFYFLSVYLGRKIKMNILLKKILEKAKRFFQIPTFKQYAIADGIFRVLFGAKWGMDDKISKKDHKQQLFKFAL